MRGAVLVLSRCLLVFTVKLLVKRKEKKRKKYLLRGKGAESCHPLVLFPNPYNCWTGTGLSQAGEAVQQSGEW